MSDLLEPQRKQILLYGCCVGSAYVNRGFILPRIW